jgi:hypothetical protein
MAFYNGSLFVTYVGGTLYQYNATTGALIAELYSSFSGNGPRIPTFGSDGSLYVPEFQTQYVDKFAATTYAYLGRFVSDPGTSAMSVAFGPDGNMIVLDEACCGAAASVKRYSIQTGASLGPFIAAGTGGLGSAIQILVVNAPVAAAPALGSQAMLALAVMLAAMGIASVRKRRMLA